MISDRLATLQSITENLSVEEGIKILYKNLEALGANTKENFIAIAKDAFGENYIHPKQNELQSDLLTIEELEKFFKAEPASPLTDIQRINTQLTMKEELQTSAKEDLKHDEPKEAVSKENLEEINHKMKEELARETELNGNFEEQMAGLVKENRKLHDIVKKCKKCVVILKGQESDGKKSMGDDSSAEESSQSDHEADHKKLADYREQLESYEAENGELRQLFEQANLKLKSMMELNAELEKRLEQISIENQELHARLSSDQDQGYEELVQKVEELTRENNKLQAIVRSGQAGDEIAHLQRLVDELTQEKEDLIQQIKTYEEEEELVSQEVEHHRQTLEETQLYIANFKQTYEEQIVKITEEKNMMVSELEAANTELLQMKNALEETERANTQLQAKLQQLEHEKVELIKQFSESQPGNIEEFQKKLSQIESEGEIFGDLAGSLLETLQDFFKREAGEFGEDSSAMKGVDESLENSINRVKAVIAKYFELKERLAQVTAERDDLIAKWNSPSGPTHGRLPSQTDQGKATAELREAKAALEQQIKGMTNYIQQLEYERDTMYRRLDERNFKNQHTTQVFELLDGALEVAFTAEETRSMTIDQKFTEMQNIVRSYQTIQQEYHNLNEERDYLQVTLDSVTNKLRAQQAEIDFLNRQIDIMRNEVAEFIKMDEFKVYERLKQDNAKLKQDIEAMKADKEKLEKEHQKALEEIKNKNTELTKQVAELEAARDKLEKDLKLLNGQLVDKIAENETLQRQVRDTKQQNEELTKLLELEREESRRKEHTINELHHQLGDANAKFEKANMLLEHERNESYKKERNLNELIQQVSQLIQKNEKANELLLQEKDRARKLEDALIESQSKVADLREKVESLTEQLEEEKRRRKDQERLGTEQRRGAGPSGKDFERVHSQTYFEKREMSGESQGKLDNLANEIKSTMKLLGKENTDSSSRAEALEALKREFSALMNQNKQLSDTIEDLKSGGISKTAPNENLNKKLRDLDLAIPEKLFDLNKPADQIEFLAKEFDRIEQERRRLAASLEAQKDDSLAKEFVISSLKSQIGTLTQAQETLAKVREEIFSKDLDKKDAARRWEALKTSLSKNRDRLFTQDFTSAEQDLIRRKDEQLFELHKKIQKLMGELRLRGYDLHKEGGANAGGNVPNESTSNQLNQMMEMMTNFMTSKNEQSSIHDTQIEEENQKLRDKLQRCAKKIKSLVEKLKAIITENKALKSKLEKWLKSCVDGIDVEVKLLRSGNGTIDQSKLSEFLTKISKNILNAEKSLSKFNEKEEQVMKELNALASEAGKVDVASERLDTSDIFGQKENRVQEEEIMLQGGFYGDGHEREPEMITKAAKKKQRTKRATQTELSDNEDLVEQESQISFPKSPRKEKAMSSNFIGAPQQEPKRSEFVAENNYQQSDLASQNPKKPQEMTKRSEFTTETSFLQFDPASQKPLPQQQGGYLMQGGNPTYQSYQQPMQQQHSDTSSQYQPGFFQGNPAQYSFNRQGSHGSLPPYNPLQTPNTQIPTSPNLQRFAEYGEGSYAPNQPYFQGYNSDRPIPSKYGNLPKNAEQSTELGSDYGRNTPGNQEEGLMRARLNGSNPQARNYSPAQTFGGVSALGNKLWPQYDDNSGRKFYFPESSQPYGKEPPSGYSVPDLHKRRESEPFERSYEKSYMGREPGYNSQRVRAGSGQGNSKRVDLIGLNLILGEKLLSRDQERAEKYAQKLRDAHTQGRNDYDFGYGNRPGPEYSIRDPYYKGKLHPRNAESYESSPYREYKGIAYTK